MKAAQKTHPTRVPTGFPISGKAGSDITEAAAIGVNAEPHDQIADHFPMS
jgi:hypothetical protein